MHCTSGRQNNRIEEQRELPISGVRRLVESPLLRSLVVVGVMTALAGLVLAARDILIARRFGVSDQVDAFLLAYMIPLFTISVVAGALNVSLIPTYVYLRETAGLAAAERLRANVTTAALLLLSLLALLLAFTFPILLPHIASSFPPAKIELTKVLFLTLLPMIVVNGLSTIWSAALNAGERFALAAATKAITPLVVTGALLGVPSLSISGVARFMVVGFVTEVAVLAMVVRRSGLILLPRWSGIDDHTRKVLFQFLPMVAGALAMGSSPLIDQSMAARLGAGGVSSLDFGNKLIGFTLGVASTAIGTVTLPAFSRMVAKSDYAGLRMVLRKYSRVIFAVAAPITLLLFVLSEPIVRLLFERGAFTHHDTLFVSRIQQGYLLQIPFFLAGIVGVRLLSALSRNKVISWIAFSNVVLNIVFNFILSRYLGVAGIALSTSLVYVSSSFWIFFAVRTILRSLEENTNDENATTG